jgi:surface antigen
VKITYAYPNLTQKGDRMRFARYVFLASLPFFLLACGQGGLTKSEGGTVVGAVAGGILGNQVGKGKGKVVATAIGAVVGGIVGSEIGRSLDEADRRAAREAEYRALEYGQSGVATPWKNPDSGHYGTVVAGKPYQLRNSNCREYTHTIYVNGKPQTMRGTACRQPDGTWRNIG